MSKLKHNTVTIQLTNPDENMGDLLHLFVLMGFQSDYTETELLTYTQEVIKDQYFQRIMNL